MFSQYFKNNFKEGNQHELFYYKKPFGRGEGNETSSVIRYGMMIEGTLIYYYILALQQREFEFKLKVSEQKDWSHYHFSLS